MMDSQTVVVRIVATGMNYTLVGVETIGDVKSGIERTLNVPSEKQILVGRNGQALLLNNDAVLNTKRPKIAEIEMYTKITPPRSITLEIIRLYLGTLDRRDLTILSDQTVASLRRQINRLFGVSPYWRRLTTLQAIMSNDRLQLCDYLLAPLPEGTKQVIMVNEEDHPVFPCCPNM